MSGEIQAALSEELRKAQWRNHPNRLAGHCYVASEALYHLMGGKEKGWTSWVMRVNGGTHWFLRDACGMVVDVTVGQFDQTPDYTAATRCGFLTRQPSKRAQVVIDRVQKGV